MFIAACIWSGFIEAICCCRAAICMRRCSVREICVASTKSAMQSSWTRRRLQQLACSGVILLIISCAARIISGLRGDTGGEKAGTWAGGERAAAGGQAGGIRTAAPADSHRPTSGSGDLCSLEHRVCRAAGRRCAEQSSCWKRPLVCGPCYPRDVFAVLWIAIWW